MERLKQFWFVVVDVWEKGLFGIDLGRIMVALLIIAGFLLVRRLTAKFLVGRLMVFAKRTQFRFDDEIVKALEDPLTLIPVVLGVFIATEYLSLSGRLEVVADQVVRSLVAYLIFWVLVRLVRPLSFLLGKLEDVFSSTIVDWLIKSIRVAFILIGAAAILEIWGIKVGPILAGLGLGSAKSIESSA